MCESTEFELMEERLKAAEAERDKAFKKGVEHCRMERDGWKERAETAEAELEVSESLLRAAEAERDAVVSASSDAKIDAYIQILEGQKVKAEAERDEALAKLETGDKMTDSLREELEIARDMLDASPWITIAPCPTCGVGESNMPEPDDNKLYIVETDEDEKYIAYYRHFSYADATCQTVCWRKIGNLCRLKDNVIAYMPIPRITS